MSSSYFYLHADKNKLNADFIERLEDYADSRKKLIYVLNRPLTDQKYSYKYTQALIVLSPKCKIAIINCGNRGDDFEDYVEDVIEDIGSISDKYRYKEIIGRPRSWRSLLVDTDIQLYDIKDIGSLFDDLGLSLDSEIKKLDLLISLFIGSINDVERVKEDIPITTLDKVKQKIQLFDGDQTRFIYENINKKKIRIQGLSGTGKTELLLHKLKDLYVSNPESRILFTCHNKILADDLRKRIPSFFNFMKVEQQIDWEKRLWCVHAWGANQFPHSGAYRYICAFYQIPFFGWSQSMSFSKACKIAIEDIKTKYPNGDRKFAFTYMFIDESQDFDENFFELCDLVTEKNIYVAGDIFQSIFDENISSTIDPDFLLGKCYRTDPKTLMFAHALGMGLFENSKLRWLEEKEWKDCGYNVEVDESKYILSREPLRRFEDLDDNFESIRIVEIETRFTDTILNIISEIISENETVKPNDIGIILLDQSKDMYQLADMLEIKIYENFKWAVNKAYESKQNRPNTILISNRNNVKGLEFPFVICVTKRITNFPSYRNSIYTMLTRSFIKSYLLIQPEERAGGLTAEMKTGLNTIITTNQMVIEEPSEDEKNNIRMRFKSIIAKQSPYDLMLKIFKTLKIKKHHHDKLMALAKDWDLIDEDEEVLTEFFKDNIKYIKD